MLQPLPILTYKNVTFKRNGAKQKVFDEVELIVTQKALLDYTDFNKQFDIHKYARDYPLVAVIIQEGRLIIFYSTKLTDPQNRYTVTEKELLIIEETLKEFSLSYYVDE